MHRRLAISLYQRIEPYFRGKNEKNHMLEKTKEDVEKAEIVSYIVQTVNCGGRERDRVSWEIAIGFERRGTQSA